MKNFTFGFLDIRGIGKAMMSLTLPSENRKPNIRLLEVGHSNHFVAVS